MQAIQRLSLLKYVFSVVYYVPEVQRATGGVMLRPLEGANFLDNDRELSKIAVVTQDQVELAKRIGLTLKHNCSKTRKQELQLSTHFAL